MKTTEYLDTAEDAAEDAVEVVVEEMQGVKDAYKVVAAVDINIAPHTETVHKTVDIVRTPGTEHNNNVTFANMMGGSTANYD